MFLVCCSIHTIHANEVICGVMIKVPGNEAKSYTLELTSENGNQTNKLDFPEVPLTITRHIEAINGAQRITVTLQAREDIYFNYVSVLHAWFLVSSQSAFT